MTTSTSIPQSEASFPQPNQLNFDFFYKVVTEWGLITVVSCVAGYFGLGIAYELGVMARIDQIAIPILKSWVGYTGLGAAMPVFQWYSAWIVRICIATVAGILCSLLQKIVFYFWEIFQRNRPDFLTF